MTDQLTWVSVMLEAAITLITAEIRVLTVWVNTSV